MSQQKKQPKQKEYINTHILFWMKVYERLYKVKEETHKSMNWLVNIFLDARFDELAKKLRYVDKEQGDEIYKVVYQIANDIQAVRRNLEGACRNFNQIAKNSNLAMKEQPVYQKSSFKITPDMRRKPIDPKEIQELESRITIREASGTMLETLPKLKKELFAARNGLFVEDVPDDYEPRMVRSKTLMLTESDLKQAFIDVESVRALNNELLKASSELSEILVNLV